MILKGKILSIGLFDGTDFGQLTYEKSSTLTITTEAVKGAGERYGTKNYPGIKSWRISGQLLLNAQQFLLLFNAMKNDEEGQTWRWGGAGQTFQGRGFITRLSFAGQGKGLVTLNLTIQGSGPLTKEQV